ncbi:MAG: hypothetical protein MHPSP_002470 [Paramarteilia canceri]
MASTNNIDISESSAGEKTNVVSLNTPITTDSIDEELENNEDLKEISKVFIDVVKNERSLSNFGFFGTLILLALFGLNFFVYSDPQCFSPGIYFHSSKEIKFITETCFIEGPFGFIDGNESKSYQITEISRIGILLWLLFILQSFMPLELHCLSDSIRTVGIQQPSNITLTCIYPQSVIITCVLAFWQVMTIGIFVFQLILIVHETIMIAQKDETYIIYLLQEYMHISGCDMEKVKTKIAYKIGKIN